MGSLRTGEGRREDPPDGPVIGSLGTTLPRREPPFLSLLLMRSPLKLEDARIKYLKQCRSRGNGVIVTDEDPRSGLCQAKQNGTIACKTLWV